MLSPVFDRFERLIKPFPPEAPEQPPQSLLAFCRHYTQGVEVHLILMSFFTGALAILEVSLFGFVGQLVDWLATKEKHTFWQEEGGTLISMAILVLVVIPLAVFLHSTIVHQALLGNYPMRVRWQIHRYLLGQSLSFYQSEFSGRIATKVMQTALSVRESVMKCLDVLLYIGVYFIGMLTVIGTADFRLVLPLIFWVIGYVSILRYFVPKLRKISQDQADARSLMTGHIVDTYTNIMTVKLFSHATREADYAQSSMQQFLDTVHPQMRKVTELNLSIWLLNVSLIFSISSLSIWLWSVDAVTPGSIAIALALALRMNGMSQWIMWEISSLFENIGSVQDGMNTIAQPREVMDKADARPIQIDKGLIEFDDIHFAYGEADPIFSRLNLTISPGEKIGIVGRSGAGKSTLVNLLMRFYELDSGSIRIDGQDIAQYQQESLRSHIGMVTQDTSLLHRSVGDNIVYGKPEADEASMISAAKKAKAHDFILDLSDPKGGQGYDAQVGERGVKLSGGQRQRIAIARVLLKNAPILLLDEATSALDSEIESAIQQNLDQLMIGKTVIAIAHRLSTIAALDRLIVLDEGKIVEEGTHEELLALDGLYAKLWKRQSGGFIGD